MEFRHTHYLKTDRTHPSVRTRCVRPDDRLRPDASGGVRTRRLRPDASGRVRFGASGFLNGAKAAHHSLRIVRWWCKGPHRAISPPSALDFVDFVDFAVQRHTPRGNFPRFLWTWGTCALGDPVAPVFVTLGHFSPPPCAKPDALRTRPAATPFFASGRVVRTRPDASDLARPAS